VNKTKIPWCDYTINPVKGLCPMACEYCYARRMYKRFGWDQEIRYNPNAFKGLPSKPSRVFVGSTMELFGSWVERDWWHMTMAKCLSRPQHTFIFLTKCPQNLPKEFPDNCWVGVTITNNHTYIGDLARVKANVKYLSIEPLLEWRDFPAQKGNLSEVLHKLGINWVIIGSQTQPTRHPQREWVDEIISACDKASIPLFIKEPLASHIGIQRQEFPSMDYGREIV